mmetsp:Transcript_13816/g.31349  ORF Transcript_13816/g.31349 Transcript_13816/m.31349 type:complete len:206 (+) Transcript_13816:209-826(+)
MEKVAAVTARITAENTPPGSKSAPTGTYQKVRLVWAHATPQPPTSEQHCEGLRSQGARGPVHPWAHAQAHAGVSASSAPSADRCSPKRRMSSSSRKPEPSGSKLSKTCMQGPTSVFMSSLPCLRRSHTMNSARLTEAASSSSCTVLGTRRAWISSLCRIAISSSSSRESPNCVNTFSVSLIRRASEGMLARQPNADAIRPNDTRM